MRPPSFTCCVISERTISHGIAEAQPLVGQLHLPAVADRLIEDAELVADAVADGRNVEARERVHVARRQPAEAAVAEPGLFFLVEDVGQVLPDLGQRLLRRLPDAKLIRLLPRCGPVRNSADR